jgi:6-phosphogluconolactonase
MFHAFIAYLPVHVQWADGIPPVMGAHLMASSTVAPISTSKGPGIDVGVHQFQYPGEANAQVVVYATAKNASAGLAKSVVEAAAAAIKEKGSFTLVLSGACSVAHCS